MKEYRKGSFGRVRRLPIVTLNGKNYFRDDRLREYRNVNNPHDRIVYENMSEYIKVYCCQCRKLLFSGTRLQARRLIIYCPDC